MTEKTALSRRHLLKLSGVAAAAPLLGESTGFAKDVPKVPRRTLGKTGQKVPILLLGGGGGFDPKFDPKLARALQHGIDYIDAARAYAGGTCEANLATTLERLQMLDKVWITSKSDAFDGAGLEREVESSLSALRRKSVDLYFLHALQDPTVLNDKALFASVDKLKKAGKIKYFGFSCHDYTVAELLTKAAGISAIDAVMFRYNFRSYGNKDLNLAIDAAHKANIGLIAMKTQGSEVAKYRREAQSSSFEDTWKSLEKTGKWTKYQAVLKAVWSDARISAAVSYMDNLEKLQQNIAAAVDDEKLGFSHWEAIERYADATRSEVCDGCGHICSAAVSRPVDIATAIRCVMYHDVYGDAEKARRVFSQLPEAARDFTAVDFSSASRVCPNGLDVTRLMDRAQQILV